MYPRVAEFYRGKTVAITGGTGSLGQAIIEKLLRCAPEVKKIILLIRKKKEVEPSERLAAYIENEVGVFHIYCTGNFVLLFSSIMIHIFFLEKNMLQFI